MSSLSIHQVMLLDTNWEAQVYVTRTSQCYAQEIYFKSSWQSLSTQLVLEMDIGGVEEYHCR